MKGVKLTDEQKAEVLRLHELGYAYAEIREKTGVSPAAQSAVVDEASRSDPDLKYVRELSRYLRQNRVAIQTMRRGARVADGLNEGGLSVEDAERYVIPFVKEAKEDALQLARDGAEFMKMAGERNLSPAQMTEQYQKTGRELDSLLVNLETTRSTLAEVGEELARRRDALSRIDILEKIDGALNEIGMGPDQAARALQAIVPILRRGMTVEQADALSREIRRLCGRVRRPLAYAAELVRQYGGMEEAVRAKERRLEAVDRELRKAEREFLAVGDEVRPLSNQKKELERDVIALRKDYSAISGRYARREKVMEASFSTLFDSLERDYLATKAERQKSIELLEVKEKVLKDNVAVLTGRVKNKRGMILASNAIYGFVVKGGAASFDVLSCLHPSDFLFSKKQLPDELRRAIIRILMRALENDGRARVRVIEDDVRMARQEGERVSREFWKTYAGVQERVNSLRRVEAAMKGPGKVWEKAAAALLNSPALLGDVLNRASDPVLVEAFMKPSWQRRRRIEGCLNSAAARAQAEEDKRFDKWLDGQVRKALGASTNPTRYGMNVPWLLS